MFINILQTTRGKCNVYKILHCYMPIIYSMSFISFTDS